MQLGLPIFREGWVGISWGFLAEEPLRSGRAGGIGSILLATAWIVGICLMTALPLSLGTAILFRQFQREAPRLIVLIRHCLDVLAGVPSIVFGLFGYAFFCQFMGLGFSILAGGLTLACMILPVMIRVLEESLAAVPLAYEWGAVSLGLSRVGILLNLLLPRALPGLIGAIIIGLGRAFAETAALLFTSGYVDRWPQSVMDSGRALSVHVYDLTMNVPGGERSAYASALALVLTLLIINTIALACLHILQRRTPANAALSLGRSR
jgi:phosphate transport system permease protein